MSFEDAHLERQRATAQRTLQHVHSASTAGRAILEDLDAQSATIDRIDDKRRSIDANVRVAHSQLSIIESFRAYIFGKKAITKAEAVAIEERQRSERVPPSGGAPVDDWEMIQDGNAAVREHDAICDDLQRGIRGLKHMALQIGTELDEQNVRLDRLNEDLEVTGANMKLATQRTQRLLKKQG